MRRQKIRKTVSGIVLWGGLLLIGALAIPAGFLFGMISFLKGALDFTLKKIDHI